jgi:ABC-type uncharacterized transport system permease subunit
MILSSTPEWSPWLLLALTALVAYGVAVLPGNGLARAAAPALSLGVLAHAGMLALDIGGPAAQGGGARLGFGPVLSLTVCLVLAVHAVESRFVPLPAVRRVLACAGAVAVGLGLAFPGEPRAHGSAWAPVHWLLGVASYGLFGAAVLHALMLDGAERRLRLRRTGSAPGAFGLPLLHLERLTFRFVQAGFAVLSVAIVMGMVSAARWRWDHKSVLSLLAWILFAALLAGRQWRGWRGQQATRWLYAGALLLLLAYAGSRFVLEVVLHRSPG